MTICKRCGKCCGPCPNLIRFKNLTSCRIYNSKKRVGTFIYKDKLGIKHYCINRLNSKWDYIGCPYNTNKPLFVELQK